MSGTGIAGAADHRPATDALTCFVCQRETEMPFSARSVPGAGFGMVCSKACAEAPQFAYQPPAFTRFKAMEALCLAMSAYLASHDPDGRLPDDTAVIEAIDNTGGTGVVVTAGMIRAAGGVV